MKNIASWKLILLGVMASACGGNMEKEYEQAKLTAEGFSAAFFNMDFDRAASFCAPESYPWIRLRLRTSPKRTWKSTTGNSDWLKANWTT